MSTAPGHYRQDGAVCNDNEHIELNKGVRDSGEHEVSVSNPWIGATGPHTRACLVSGEMYARGCPTLKRLRLGGAPGYSLMLTILLGT